MINTKCTHCLFRVNDDSGNQVDCSLGKIKTFIKRGEARLENDYYVIDRFCNTCRSEGYTKESIIKETQISCTFIVYGDNDYWQNLKSLLNQTIKPKNVFVVFKDMESFDKQKYDQYQEMFNNEGVPLIFKKYFEDKPFPNMIDDVVKKCESQFYIPTKRRIKPTFIEEYNKLINEDLVQLNAHFKRTLFESFVSCTLHSRFNGNNGELLSKKVKDFLENIDHPVSQKEKDTIIFETI